MIEYLRFLMGNKRLISFGFFMTFFSSFGQTFLISLYVPHLIKEFNLNNSSFGFLYSAATICSSIALIYLGKYIDHKSLRSYTLASAALLIFSCLLTAFSMNIIFIFAGLLGLRLSGQGLFSHISKTSISKKFSKARGKALSLSVLGYSFGEGIFPFVISSLIAILGWRGSMALSSVFIALFLIPFVFFALNKNEFKARPRLNSDRKEKNNFSRKELFREQGFYILALNTVILPALITGLFFYQMTLAAEKGWVQGWLPACFLAYAAGRTIFSLLSGKLIDKFTAAKLLPLYLIPFLIGLLALVFASHPLVAPFYLALTGISMGLGSTIKSAIAAEAYGTRNLGSIMSLLAMFMVFGTAVTPVLFGFLLDRGFNFSFIAAISAIIVSLTAFLSYQAAQSYNFHSSEETLKPASM